MGAENDVSWRGSLYSSFSSLLFSCHFHPRCAFSVSISVSSLRYLPELPLVFLPFSGRPLHQVHHAEPAEKIRADDDQAVGRRQSSRHPDERFGRRRYAVDQGRQHLSRSVCDDAAPNSARSSSPPEPGAMPGSQLQPFRAV